MSQILVRILAWVSQILVPRSSWIAHLKVRLDTRRYLASKLFPRQYGKRLEVGVTQQIPIRAALDTANGRAGVDIDG